MINKDQRRVIANFTAFQVGLQKYCDTAYARRSVNQMWILEKSKELLKT